MKSTNAKVKPKIIKKLSANEQELSAGKINTKTAVKKVQRQMISTNCSSVFHFLISFSIFQVLHDISNNANVIIKPDSKVYAFYFVL